MKFFLSVCLSLAPVTAFSQSADWAEGTATVGYLEDADNSENFVFGDFTLKWAQGTWGGELGMFGAVGRLHETYAAATYRTDAGILSFGFPRPSYDDFASSALTKIMPRLSLESIGSIRSRTTYGTMNLSEFLPYGAHYSSQTAAVDYSMSLHAVPDYPDVIAGGAVRLTQGPWTVDFATEAVVQSDVTQWNTKAQIVGVSEHATFGFGIFNPQANDQNMMVEAFSSFEVSDQAEITSLVRMSASDDPMFGLGLAQQISSQWFVLAGVYGSDKGDLAASASLNMHF